MKRIVLLGVMSGLLLNVSRSNPEYVQMIELIQTSLGREQSNVHRLIAAAATGHEDIVMELYNQGTPINASNRDNKTALMRAAEKKQAAMVRMLVGTCGARVDLQNFSGETALSLALAQKNNEPVINYLLECTHSDSCALRVAMRERRLDVAKKLVRAGTNINRGIDQHMNPLTIEIARGSLIGVKFLLAHGALVNRETRLYAFHTADMPQTDNLRVKILNRVVRHKP